MMMNIILHTMRDRENALANEGSSKVPEKTEVIAVNTFSQEQTQASRESLTGRTWKGIQDIAKTRPIKMIWAMALGIGASFVSGNMLVGGIAAVSLYNKKGDKSIIDKFMMLTAFTSAVSALQDWDSLRAARRYYSGPPCEGLVSELMDPFVNCINIQSQSTSNQIREFLGSPVVLNISECLPEAPSLEMADSEVSIFTRHHSDDTTIDPFSKLQVKQDRICRWTSLEKASKTTKTCFEGRKGLKKRTVEASNLSLREGHEGLKPGESAFVFEIHIKDKIRRERRLLEKHQSQCAYFRAAFPTPPINKEKEVCDSSALDKNGDVSKLCFDPDNPGAMTLTKVNGKEADVVRSLVQADGKPVSVLQDLSEQTPCLAEQSKGVSLTEAFSWWWTQERPTCQQ